MGKAVVIEHIGESLYRVRRKYDTARLEYERARLVEREASHFARLNDALRSLGDLRRAKAEAADGLDEVVNQWLDGLISKLNEEPPAIAPPDPNDPETGQPWEDADRAQDGPLFDAINAERTAASIATLTRNADLDRSILRHLRALGATGRIRHDERGWDASDRARSAGYDFDPAVGVGQALAFGTRGPAPTVALWMRRGSDRAWVLGEAVTECGVAYVYNPRNPYSYLWGAVFAAPGAPLPAFAPPEPDAAEHAADEATTALDKIPIPTVDGFSPDKLGEVTGEFAKAARRVVAAEVVVAEIVAEQEAIRERKAEIDAILAEAARVIDVWCSLWATDVPVGATVNLATVPGYQNPVATPSVTVFGVRNDPYNTQPATAVSYEQRDMQIVPDQYLTGTIRPALAMTDAEAFVNAALEPGHLRWKPLFRYATITGRSGDVCDLVLTPLPHRGEDAADLVMDDPESLALSAVPISYPPCNGEAFDLGDAVLVLFEGRDRAAPKVIGFRREPRPCPAGRMSWSQG